MMLLQIQQLLECFLRVSNQVVIYFHFTAHLIKLLCMDLWSLSNCATIVYLFPLFSGCYGNMFYCFVGLVITSTISGIAWLPRTYPEVVHFLETRNSFFPFFFIYLSSPFLILSLFLCSHSIFIEEDNVYHVIPVDIDEIKSNLLGNISMYFLQMLVKLHKHRRKFSFSSNKKKKIGCFELV